LVVVYLITLLRKGSALHAQRLLALSGLALLAAQVTVGAFDALLGAPAALADVHLALASALWAVVVAVAYLSARGTRDRTAPVCSRVVERRSCRPPVARAVDEGMYLPVPRWTRRSPSWRWHRPSP